MSHHLAKTAKLAKIHTQATSKAGRYLTQVAFLASFVLFPSAALACNGDQHSWKQKSPNLYEFIGSDTCGGSKKFQLFHNEIMVPVEQNSEGSYRAFVSVVDGRNSVLIRNTAGEFVAVLDTIVVLDTGESSSATSLPVELDQLTFDQPPTFSVLENQSGTDWARRSDLQLNTAQLAASENDRETQAQIQFEKTGERGTGNLKAVETVQKHEQFFTVEMTWKDPVDLDLHIFEPAASGRQVVNSLSPGHVWTKAQPSLRELAQGTIYETEIGADKPLNREVYELRAANGVSLEGSYVLKIDYLDRTIRRNLEPLTCDQGLYATPEVTLHIRTAYFSTKKPYKVPGVACGKPLVLGQILSTIGTIQLK